MDIALSSFPKNAIVISSVIVLLYICFTILVGILEYLSKLTLGRHFANINVMF